MAKANLFDITKFLKGDKEVRYCVDGNVLYVSNSAATVAAKLSACFLDEFEHRANLTRSPMLVKAFEKLSEECRIPCYFSGVTLEHTVNKKPQYVDVYIAEGENIVMTMDKKYMIFGGNAQGSAKKYSPLKFTGDNYEAIVMPVMYNNLTDYQAIAAERMLEMTKRYKDGQ